MSVSLTNLVAPTIAETKSWTVDQIAQGYKTDQRFEVYNLRSLREVDATGAITTFPLGTHGPFVLLVDSEQILCGDADYDTQSVTVYNSSLGNGRGYSGTTIAAHTPGGSGTPNVTVVSTSTSPQPVVPTASTVTLTSGTAVQNTASTGAIYYIGITGGTAGTVSVAIGATSATATTIIPAVAGNAANSQTLTVKVPTGWYIKVTTSVATINASTVIVTQSI